MTNYDAAFHALADPTRRAVLVTLAQGPRPVSELAAPHAMALPTFLKHLRVLEDAALIATEKRGRTRHCALRPEALRPLEGWLAAQRETWAARTDRLADHLERENPDV